jgi:hypothetical protein
MPRKLAPRLWELARETPAPPVVPPPSDLERALVRIVGRAVKEALEEHFGRKEPVTWPQMIRLGDAAAKAMGISPDLLRRWRQEPDFPEVEPGWCELGALTEWLRTHRARREPE